MFVRSCAFLGESNKRFVDVTGEDVTAELMQPFAHRSRVRALRLMYLPDPLSDVQEGLANETDVYVIYERCLREGFMPEGNGPGQYGDVSDLNRDLTGLMAEAMDTVSEANAFADDWEAKRAEAEQAASDNARVEALLAERLEAEAKLLPPVV